MTSICGTCQMLYPSYPDSLILDEIDVRWSFQSSINRSFLRCLQRPWRLSVFWVMRNEFLASICFLCYSSAAGEQTICYAASTSTGSNEAQSASGRVDSRRAYHTISILEDHLDRVTDGTRDDDRIGVKCKDRWLWYGKVLREEIPDNWFESVDIQSLRSLAPLCFLVYIIRGDGTQKGASAIYNVSK